MGKIRWLGQSEVEKHYTPVFLKGQTFYVDRRNNFKILRKLSFSKNAQEFRVEIIDDAPRRNAVSHAYNELLSKSSR